MYTIKDILQIEVAPALGCTEPVAVAFCTACAGALLEDKSLDRLEVWLSANIYKNALAVAIPGTQGATGIDLAATLGFIAGDPKLRLQVLEPIDEKALTAARSLIQQDKVQVHLLRDKTKIYIKARLQADDTVAEAIVEQTHDHLTHLSLNDREIKEHPLLTKVTQQQHGLTQLEEFLRGQTLEQLLVLVEDMDEEDAAFIQEGLEVNLELARHGLAFGDGLGIGKTMERLVREGLLRKDMILAARILTSSAADARMSGVKLPAMSSAGSGNHGLTAILPIWAVQQFLNEVELREVQKAIALSHLITGYVKAHTGRLSAVCGCSVAAGITYLMGGGLSHIASAIKNLISDLAGAICDGAKGSCALKLSTAAGTAVQSALFSLHGITVGQQDGMALWPSARSRPYVTWANSAPRA